MSFAKPLLSMRNSDTLVWNNKSVLNPNEKIEKDDVLFEWLID